MSRAKHPLVAAYGSDTATDLISQGLKRQTVIRFSECTGERNRWAIQFELAEEYVESLRVAAIKHMLIADIRNSPAFTTDQLSRQMKAMNGVEKEQAANSIVEIFAGPPILIEFTTLAKQLCERQRTAFGIE